MVLGHLQIFRYYYSDLHDEGMRFCNTYKDNILASRCFDTPAMLYTPCFHGNRQWM